ncbi:hypothetical protein [Shimazuella soli]|nr:hypothetical protein [Shimazuella soli]
MIILADDIDTHYTDVDPGDQHPDELNPSGPHSRSFLFRGPSF